MFLLDMASLIGVEPSTEAYVEMFLRRRPGSIPSASGLRGFEMTQADFASRIGVSQSYLSAVEHGRNELGAQVLLAISREFDKSMEWLLTGEE